MSDAAAATGEATAPRPLRLGTAAGRWVLVATVLGSGMAMLDSTVVNLALPRIGSDLGASFTGLQWILNGYTLALAGLILLGGGLGDRLGRRRVFLVGATWFAIASLCCALAPNTPVLVAARVLQGIGAALLTPGSLAIIQSSFASGDRARAIGAWSGLGGAAAAIGPFLGGWLVDAASWRWIFLINVPMGVAVVLIGRAHVPETRDAEAAGTLDATGAVLGAGALTLVTLGLSEQRWLLVAAGAATLATFVVFELRHRDPLLPMGVFANRTFSGTNVVTVLLYGAMAVVFFLLGLVLQGPLGYSPLEAGAATVPITISMLALSARSGALAGRIGARLPMTVGPLLVAAALVMMTRIDVGSRYATTVLPAVVVFGLGLTLTVAPLTATALAAVEDRHAGIASGVNNAVARTGQLLAVAAVPVVAGFVPATDIGGEALVSGFHRLLWTGAAAVVVAAAVAWTTVGDRRPAETPGFHCAASGPPPVPERAAAGRRAA